MTKLAAPSIRIDCGIVFLKIFLDFVVFLQFAVVSSSRDINFFWKGSYSKY